MTEVIEDRKIESKIGKKLRIDIGVIVRDKNGNIVEERSQEAKSWLTAFNDWLYVRFKYSGANSDITTKDTGGVDRALRSSAVVVISGAGDSSVGIVVGTGSTPVLVTQYALATQISHGTGAGQLSYGSTGYTDPATVGSSTSFKISRQFANSSGGGIVIQEVGLYGQINFGGGAYYNFALDRTLLTVSVADGGSVTITYTITVTT